MSNRIKLILLTVAFFTTVATLVLFGWIGVLCLAVIVAGLVLIDIILTIAGCLAILAYVGVRGLFVGFEQAFNEVERFLN